MKTTGWYNTAANDALIGGGAIGTHCLANPGKEYIVYKSGAGAVTLNVAGVAAPLAAKWFDLYTGTQSALPDQGNGTHTFTNPSADAGFLYLGPP
jgi:Putative collagen-binding domain of a collagenase